MIVVALFLTLGALVASDPTIKYNVLDTPLLYQKFKADYNKKYSVEEETNRYQIFKNNLKKINELNAKSLSATFGITEYSDLTREEFRAAISCLRNTTRRSVNDYTCEVSETLTNDAPDSWDWQEKGKVTPVKKQGACRSCWAFSTIGNVEGVYAIKHNSLEVLSEQQLVDCDTKDSGCNGGLMNVAMEYLVENHGSMSSIDYPYIATGQPCRFDASKVKAKVVGCKSYDSGNQDKNKETLFKNGPMSERLGGKYPQGGVSSNKGHPQPERGGRGGPTTSRHRTTAVAENGPRVKRTLSPLTPPPTQSGGGAIDAATLQSYDSGIMHQDDCPDGELNHGVLLVGYGSENGVPYWNLKNSWGAAFGEKGYFRLVRNADENPCNIYGDPMWTVVVE